VNVTPAAIESTVALPCGPRPLLAAGARRVSAPSRPDSDRAEADAAKTAFLQACERPRLPWPACSGEGHTLARAFKSGALPAWPTCRTGGNQRTVWPQIF